MALFFPNSSLNNADLRDFVSRTIDEGQSYSTLQNNLQRHVCSSKCLDNIERRCKDFPIFFIKDDITLKKSRRTVQANEILASYRKVISEISNSGVDFKKLYSYTPEDILALMNCSYTEYLHAISTTLSSGEHLFFKQSVHDAYTIPHNKEATYFFNAQTHALFCRTLAVAMYLSKYTTKWDEGGKSTETSRQLFGTMKIKR